MVLEAIVRMLEAADGVFKATGVSEAADRASEAAKSKRCQEETVKWD